MNPFSLSPLSEVGRSFSSKKFRILVSDSVDPTGIDILRSIGDVDLKTKLSEDQLCEIIGDYDALMVRSGTQVTKRIIQAGRKLKIIGRAGVGVDNVDVDVATSAGIFVVNSPQGNTVAAAEHAIAMMFSLARKIPVADSSLRTGKWEREKFMGFQLQHKTLGIIGLGQVGSRVAKVCREIGMDLMCYDPYINVAKAQSLGCRVAELDEVLTDADIITLHVPLVAETKHLMNQDRLAKMKKTALLINCSRGGVVDEMSLCDALRDGRLGGAALDVFEHEGKFAADSPLLSAPNLVLTPHLGASTFEAQINVAVDVAQQIRSTLLGSLPESAVNIPGLGAAELVHLRPLIECCEILGRLSVQLLTKPLEEIVVGVEGPFAYTEKSEVLLMAAANGAIGIHTATRVNFVNVRQIAEQHRIKMVLVKDENRLKGSITVEVRSAGHVAHIRATVTDDNEVLLKSFDGIPVYMPLPTSFSRNNQRPSSTEGSPIQKFADKGDSTPPAVANGFETYNRPKNQYMGSNNSRITLVYSLHDDVPGVLAGIASVLADAGLNIGNCHLGRERSVSRASSERASALAIFHVDGECPLDIAEKVHGVKAVRVCKVLNV